MVLQRLQSLLLFLAFALMLVFCFVPFRASLIPASGLGGIYPSDCPAVLFTGIVSAVLIFITIFLFKNLKIQKAVTLLDMLLTAGAGITAVCCAQTEISSVTWLGGVTLAGVALVLEIIALTRMSRDARLLRESSRLR